MSGRAISAVTQMAMLLTMLKIQESLSNLKKTKGRYRAVRLCTLFPGSLLGAGIVCFP